MIDPNDVTKFDRDDEELLEFWLFCLFVRGKNADVQAAKLELFIAALKKATLQKSLVGALWCVHSTQIKNALTEAKTGMYTSLTRAIVETRPLLGKLGTVKVADLEAIPGVGPKTSRFFIMHSQAKARVAALDTHILRFLHEREGLHVPKSTPTGKKYDELERAFLTIADFEGVEPAAMDIAVWRAARERHTQAWREFL